jgi:TonB family protein
MTRFAVLFFAVLLALPIVAAGHEVKPPKVLDAVEAEYTGEAMQAKVQGKVVLDLTVGKKGRVEKVEVVEPLSHGLTESAVDAARQWKFEPLQDGKSVKVRITIRFEL